MLSMGFLTLNIIILLVIALALFSWSLYSGKAILARLILLFYPTTLIFQNIPYVDLDGAVSKIGAYIAIYIALFILLKKNTGAKKLYSGGRKTLDGIILTVAALIVILTIYYHILPINDLYDFTLPFSSLFTKTIPVGILYVIPLLGLLLTNRSDS